MATPFLCSKCGNWYIDVPVGEDEFCVQCDRNSHAAHPKTGIVDCHFGQQTPHPSELGMAKVLLALDAFQGKVDGVRKGIGQARTPQELREFLTSAESLMAAAEKEQGKIPELLRWSGVFEMPGMDPDPTIRFKSIEVMSIYVNEHRRPASDLAYVRRSTKNCNEMAEQVPEKMATLRVGLNQVRQTADSWKAPQDVPAAETVPGRPGKLTPAQSLAKARAAKRQKELVGV